MPTGKDKYQLTQNDIMFDQVFLLIRFIGLPLMSLLCVFLIDEVFYTEISLRAWNSTKLLAICAILFWGVALFISRRLRRVFHYYAITTIATLFIVFPTFVITLLAAPTMIGLTGWIISAILAIVFIFSYVEYFFDVFALLNVMEKSYQKAGFLFRPRANRAF